LLKKRAKIKKRKVNHIPSHAFPAVCNNGVIPAEIEDKRKKHFIKINRLPLQDFKRIPS
jgi:hypothetical protein